jgi:hypothetical protein
VSKIPAPGYGTRDSPGHIALWLISLGTQKDSILQWLGKDELIKHKTIESAVKFIRARLMEGRAQSESRQDFDAKLTPIRYEDLRHTQGESHTRLQTSTLGRPPFVTPRRHENRPHLSSLAMSTQQPVHTTDAEYNDDDASDDDVAADDSETHDPVNPEEDTLLAINSDLNRSRSAVSDTYRGYCSELFVYGKCLRQHSGCTFDHSSAGQERCIQSFSLLTKRELQQHAQLEPLSRAIQPAHTGKTTNTYGTKHAGPPVRPYVRTTSSRPYQK